ncbi:DNA topoisomerase 2 [Tanacetum coccineum]
MATDPPPLHSTTDKNEEILTRPETYTGSVKRTMWIWKNDDILTEHHPPFVPDIYKLFDGILVNAADKQQNPNLTSIKVRIDVANNLISVRNNGEEDVFVPELILDKRVTSNNHGEWHGANLVNIYLSEFTIETADGKRTQQRYKQKSFDEERGLNCVVQTSMSLRNEA